MARGVITVTRPSDQLASLRVPGRRPRVERAPPDEPRGAADVDECAIRKGARGVPVRPLGPRAGKPIRVELHIHAVGGDVLPRRPGPTPP